MARLVEATARVGVPEGVRGVGARHGRAPRLAPTPSAGAGASRGPRGGRGSRGKGSWCSYGRGEEEDDEDGGVCYHFSFPHLSRSKYVHLFPLLTTNF